MSDPGHPAWFVGDLDDPWVATIADALPHDTRRIGCAGRLPDEWPEAEHGPEVLILHRNLLTPHDAEWLARWRAGRAKAKSARVVLCVGAHVRHAELEAVATLVDEVIPETVARDTLARHLPGGGRRGAAGSNPARPVTVLSEDYELRETLAQACEAAGYRARSARDPAEAESGGPVVWDVPILRTDWPRGMERCARGGPLVALLGFADRALVRQARDLGASACLELPCDVADLVFVLDRLSAGRAEPAHEVPPPPVASRRKKPGPRSDRRAGPAGPAVAEPGGRA